MSELRQAAQAARDLLADMPIPDGYYLASSEVISLLDAALAQPPAPTAQPAPSEFEETDPDNCEHYCPHCGGSGEVEEADSAGPDAHMVTVFCPHCDGNGTLIAAYRGVVKLLYAEKRKYMKVLGEWYCLKHFAQPVQQPGAEPWVVVRQSVLDVGRGDDVRTGGKPELGYALISDAGTFDSQDEAMDAIKSAGLPIGWVCMPVSRLLPDLFEAAPAQRQPLTAEAVFASKDFMSMNGLYWGLGIETLMQIVRVTERECAAAWGVTLAQKGEKL